MNRMITCSFVKGKLCSTMLSIMIVVVLSACGSQIPLMRDDALPTTSSPENSESATSGVLVLYTTSYSIHVDSDRTLTLALQGRLDTSNGFDRYGIGAIDVWDGDVLLQTISIQERFEQTDRFEGQAWTDCWDENGNLFVEDLNFDGAEDIRLMASAGVANISYLCWLWSPEAGQFLDSFELLGYDIQIDKEAQQIVTKTRGSWGNYYTDFYAYDECGNLQHVKQIHQDYTTEDQPE